MARRVLVTGGAGFIGGHVATAFLARGDVVTVLDDLSSGSRDAVPGAAGLVQGSVTDDALLRAIAAEPIDVTVHCAAQISVQRSMLEPDVDRAVNLEGTIALLRAVAPARPRFVFFSTGGAIYGDREAPATEDAPVRPRSFYGLHKFAAESYVAMSGLSYAILRPSNVYGPGQRADTEGGVVSIFARRLLAGLSLTVFGGGQQQRDFVFVDDVVAAVLALAESPLDGTWNVGTGSTTTVLALVAALEAAVGRNATIEHREPRAGEVRYSCLDASRLIATGLWAPRTALAEGLHRTIASLAPA